MSVFDMPDLTPTRKSAAGMCKDREVPINNGVADGSRIGGSNFLSGITAGVSDSINDGIEQSIINGDQVSEVRGTRTAKITGDKNTHIIGSLKILVDGSEERAVKTGRITHIGNVAVPMEYDMMASAVETLRIGGSRYTYITVNDTTTVLGMTHVTVIGGENKNKVSNWFEFYGYARAQYGWGDLKLTCIGNVTAQPIKLDVQFFKSELTANKVALKITQQKLKVIDFDGSGGKEILAVVKLIAGGISTKLDGLGV